MTAGIQGPWDDVSCPKCKKSLVKLPNASSVDTEKDWPTLRRPQLCSRHPHVETQTLGLLAVSVFLLPGRGPAAQPFHGLMMKSRPRVLID